MWGQYLLDRCISGRGDAMKVGQLPSLLIFAACVPDLVSGWLHSDQPLEADAQFGLARGFGILQVVLRQLYPERGPCQLPGLLWKLITPGGPASSPTVARTPLMRYTDAAPGSLRMQAAASPNRNHSFFPHVA